MALPVVKTLAECADFSRTVAPYIYQLAPLPRIIFESISNPAALKQIYLDTNPLISAFAFSLFLSPIFLLISEINRNYSQVDRMWSLLPTIYNAHYTLYAHMSGLDTKRIDTLLVASAIWSTRLTFNYWRKGGYSIGSEDYRWELLRAKIPPSLFFVFNVLFISLAQSILLFLVSTPTYILLLASRLSSYTSKMPNWDDTDLIASWAMAGLVIVTFVADQQQWNFQNAKQHYQKTAKVPAQYEQVDLDRGFLTNGLWGYSRHPNFAAEQTFWVVLYQWSCFLTGSLYNWTGAGAIAYLILFQASTWYTELVSAGKYPDYKVYQKRVGKFLPKIGAGTMKWTSTEKDSTVATHGKDSAKARERYNLR